MSYRNMGFDQIRPSKDFKISDRLIPVELNFPVYF